MAQKVESMGIKTNKIIMSYYVRFTVLFVITIFLVFMWYIISGKDLVYSEPGHDGDGIVQHYNTLAYYGDYLRKVLHVIFIEHSFDIPLWDMRIGYGSDIITTMSYYVLGDPFSALSIFVPKTYTQLLYNFLIMFRIYCAGLAFSFYARKKGNEDRYVLLGAITYSFCGYILYVEVVHPYFANPMIYLPLLLYGVDKIFTEKKPYLFICSVAISAISNFYFFYMLVMMVILYAIYRYWAEYHTIKIKQVLTWIGKFIIYGFAGVLLGGITLIPSIIQLINTARLGISPYVPILYSLRYYLQLPGSYIVGNIDSYSNMGYTVVGVFLLLTLFCNAKKYKNLIAAFIIGCIMLCVPFAGHVMNGMGYVANRWVFAFSFLMCYSFTRMIPEFLKMSNKKRKIITIVSFLVSIGVYCVYLLKNGVNMNLVDKCTVLMIVVILLLAMFIIVLYENREISLRRKTNIILVVQIFCIWVNAYYLYAPGQTNYLSKYNVTEIAQNLLENASTALAKEDSEYLQVSRCDMNALTSEEPIRNSSLQNGVWETSYYYSTPNPNLEQFFRFLYINESVDQWARGLDGRSFLDNILSVSHFVTAKGNESYVPYGFVKTGIQNMSSELYRNENILPMVYTYDSIYLLENFEKISPAQRQQIMLQSAVVEENNILKSNNPNLTDKELDYNITEVRGGEVKENEIEVTSKDNSLTLTFEGLDQCETYIVFDQIQYKDSTFEKNSLIKKLYSKENSAGGIIVQADNVQKSMFIPNNHNREYCGRHDFLVNMGYHENGLTQVTLTFSVNGTYSMDGLHIVCQPVDNLPQYIQKLKEDDIQINQFCGKIGMGNVIDVDIELKENKMVVFSVPYSEGWKAYLDGEQCDIHKVNLMYMGIEVEKGNHSIILKYETPYLRLMVVCSLSVLIILIVYYLKFNKHK